MKPFTVRLGHRFEPPPVHHELLQGTGLLLAFRLRPGTATAYLVIAFFSHLLPILFLFAMGAALARNSVSIAPAYLVTAMVLIAIADASIIKVKLAIEADLSARLCDCLKMALNATIPHSTSSLHHRERVISRDFNVVLDLACAGLEVVLIPMVMFSSTAAIVLTAGWPGLALALCTLGFLPLMYGVSLLAKNNFGALSKLVNERVELSSEWLRAGPYLKQFGSTSILAAIQKTTRDEMGRRNVDSIYRGADAYLLGFGQLLPFCLLAILGTASFQTQDATTFWLAFPLISAVIRVPNTLLDLATLKRSLADFCTLSSPTCSGEASQGRIEAHRTTESPVLFNQAWPIWPAPIRDFLLLSDSSTYGVIPGLLVEFGLTPELGSSVDAVLSYELTLDGSNVSAGQRTRLQLLRGIRLAGMQGKPLRIDDALASLDPSTRSKVCHALGNLVDPRVIWHHALPALDTYHAQTVLTPGGTMIETASRASCSPRSRFEPPLKLYMTSLCLMVIPASMMSSGANLVMGATTLSPFQTALFALSGIVLGTAVGVGTESRLRTQFSRLLFQGLSTPTLDHVDDQLQVVVKDSTVSFERIAWYTHDISWLGALLLCSFGSVIVGAGGLGLAVVFFLAAALITIYRRSINGLHVSRLNHLQGFRHVLNATQISYVFSSDAIASFDQSRVDIEESKKALITKNIDSFYTSRLATIRARLHMSMTCRLAIDWTLVALVMLHVSNAMDSHLVYVAITSMLLVRSHLTNAFLAITGYKSHSLSLVRLHDFAQHSSAPRPVLRDDAIYIPGFFCRRGYRAVSLSSGKLYAFVGKSGAGKSDYLRGIAGLNRSVAENAQMAGAAVKVIYLDANCMKWVDGREPSTQSIVPFLAGFPPGDPYLFLLDEVLIESSKDTCGAMSALTDYCHTTKNTIIVVDHLHAYERRIDIDELILRAG